MWKVCTQKIDIFPSLGNLHKVNKYVLLFVSYIYRRDLKPWASGPPSKGKDMKEAYGFYITTSRQVADQLNSFDQCVFSLLER